MGVLEVSLFYIKPRCVRVAASAKPPSAQSSIDRWEAARARSEGGGGIDGRPWIKLWGCFLARLRSH